MCVLPETLELCTLSKNQILLIEHILDGELELNSPVFLDIIPFSSINYDIKVSKLSTSNLIKHYTCIFNALSQVVCKGLAKEWVKVICPRKQALYPYKLSKKPSWWPRDVPHIEPDHLDKENRVKLLVAILRNDDINLIDLKRSINNSSFGAKFNAKQNNGHVHRLIYELFYLNLYERLFNGDKSYPRFVEKLSKADIQMLSKKKAVYVRVSCLDDAFKNDLANNEVPVNDFVYHLGEIESTSKSEALKWGNRAKRPLTQANPSSKRVKTRYDTTSIKDSDDDLNGHDIKQEIEETVVIKREDEYECDTDLYLESKIDYQVAADNICDENLDSKVELTRSMAFCGDLKMTSTNYDNISDPEMISDDFFHEFPGTNSDDFLGVTNDYIGTNSLYSEEEISSIDSPFTPISDLDLKEGDALLTMRN